MQALFLSDFNQQYKHKLKNIVFKTKGNMHKIKKINLKQKYEQASSIN
jgi:hypothetical protein